MFWFIKQDNIVNNVNIVLFSFCESLAIIFYTPDHVNCNQQCNA